MNATAPAREIRPAVSPTRQAKILNNLIQLKSVHPAQKIARREWTAFSYQELVFQKVMTWRVWQSIYHHTRASASCMVVLECGHIKSYPMAHAPRYQALCMTCTLMRREEEHKIAQQRQAEAEAREKAPRGKLRPGLEVV